MIDMLAGRQLRIEEWRRFYAAQKNQALAQTPNAKIAGDSPAPCTTGRTQRTLPVWQREKIQRLSHIERRIIYYKNGQKARKGETKGSTQTPAIRTCLAARWLGSTYATISFSN